MSASEGLVEDLPEDGGVAADEGVGAAEGAVADGDVEADAAARELAEHNALAAVFDDVRAQSAASALVEPARWAEIGLVPDHLTPDDFEMFVYEYLEDDRAARAEAEEAARREAPVYRTATTAVGVPRLFGSAPAAVAEEASPGEDAPAGESVELGPESAPDFEPEFASESEPASDDDPFAHLNIPAGYKLVELEGEYVLVPDEDAKPVELPIECESVVALVGAHSYYLYDRSVMTDAYAHWTYLAAEDDRVVTFVDCVREDSRVYPRPLAASSLGNPPFNLTEEEVEQTWDVVRASGEYPDVQQTVASNGDVYYFSTDYLSPAYAASLAEWDAVERKMHL